VLSKSGLPLCIEKKWQAWEGSRKSRANTACSLAQLLNRLFPAIERTNIDRARSARFRLPVISVYGGAVEAHVRAWGSGLESTDGEGRERKLSFGDFAVAVEIEPSI
jgi:hypothetical protein